MNTVLSGTMDARWLIVCMAAYGLTAAVALMGEALAVGSLLGGAKGSTTYRAVRRIAFWLLCVALVLNAAMIGTAWVQLERPPFKTLYETLLLYPLCIAVVSIALVRLHRVWPLIGPAALGALVSLFYAWAKPDLELIVLPPALQSAWFVPHVVTYFIAYAGLFVAFALAVLSLAIGFFRTKPAQETLTPDVPLPLEEAAHKAAVFGFFALTLGLAMGAAWGKAAWGDYWQWDPKENWAFITWLAYLGYLHLRLIGAWRGRRSLWVNLACFAAVLFTYLGMHLLPSASNSLHVYQ